ncbi:MAG: flippase [Actinomycetota bacterium]
MAKGTKGSGAEVLPSDAEPVQRMRAADAGNEDMGSEVHRREVLRIARGGGVNLAGATFNQILKLGITLVLARLLGRGQAGLYFQAYAFLALLGIVAAGGFTQSLTRFVALHRADGDAARLRGTVRLGLLLSAGAAAALGGVLYALSPWLAASAFEDPHMAALLRLVALSLPATVFTDAALAATRGFKTMRPYARINLFFEPSMRIVLTVGLVWAGWGVRGAMVALLVTNVASSVLSALALRGLMGPQTVRARYSTRELLTFSSLSWGSAIASNGLLWADTILLGLYRSPVEVGMYQVATRLTVLATTFINPVALAFAPLVADLYRKGRYESLQRTYALITSWIFRLAVPSLLVLIVFPRELLGFFGPGFATGAGVTMLLAIGQTVNAASGPCGYMLVMSGRPALLMASNTFALVLNLGLNVWLIPRYGIVGAAAAWGTSIILVNTIRVLAVRRTLSMWPFDAGVLKGVAAGAVAAAGGWTAATLLDGPSSLLLGGVLIVAVYFLCLGKLGIGADDRLVLDTMWRRLRPGRT